jgi:hypothetical protein
MKRAGARLSRRIVIDADVLSAASQATAGPPPGAACRQILQTVLEVCHRAVISPALQREYLRHRSRFGSRWLSAMYARKKAVKTQARDRPELSAWLHGPKAGLTDRQKNQVEKDAHLVAAALETDGLVVSRDTEVRSLLARCTALADLVWAPAASERVVAWLEGGARPERAFRLGASGLGS